MSIRLPPTVHGEGDHGFIPQIVEVAKAKGVSAYVGDGSGRWPAVHRIDAASAYRLALEKGTKGATYHAVAEEGVATKAIAEVIGRRLGVPVVSVAPEEAGAHFGFLGMFFGLDAPASSAMTQAELGWSWSQPDLLTDSTGTTSPPDRGATPAKRRRGRLRRHKLIHGPQNGVILRDDRTPAAFSLQ